MKVYKCDVVDGLYVQIFCSNNETKNIKHKMIFSGNVLKVICYHEKCNLKFIRKQVQELIKKYWRS